MDTLQREWLKCLSECADVFRQSVQVLTSMLQTADEREQFRRADRGRQFARGTGPLQRLLLLLPSLFLCGVGVG